MKDSVECDKIQNALEVVIIEQDAFYTFILLH